MSHQTFEFRAQDGLRLFGQEWVPTLPSKGLVCLIHGLGEHSGRYAHLGAFLNQNQYSLISFDLRGHGRSEGLRGHTPHFDSFMADMDCFLDQARTLQTGLPLFLYGHSMGGILVLNYVLRRKPALAGVIVTGAGLRTALEKQKAKVLLAKVLGALLPRMTLPSGLNPETISRDPAVVQAYVNDPLVHDRLSLGMGRQLIQAIDYAFQHAHDFPPVPLLMMHGKDDVLGYASGTEEFARSVPQDCTLKIWDGLRHEIHNEPGQGQVFDFLLVWMNRVLGAESESKLRI